MNEHERTVRAAQQVDKMIGFYVHFVVFLLVCGGLAGVNWFATPEVWWAQWPFLGWGVAVVFHALCAFGSGPNVVAGWRLRKIRGLADPTPPIGAARSGSTAVKTMGLLVLGLLIGGAAGGGYMYMLMKETKDQLGQLQTDKQVTEQALKEARDQLVKAESARDAAERALAEAKKEKPQ